MTNNHQKDQWQTQKRKNLKGVNAKTKQEKNTQPMDNISENQTPVNHQSTYKESNIQDDHQMAQESVKIVEMPKYTAEVEGENMASQVEFQDGNPKKLDGLQILQESTGAPVNLEELEKLQHTPQSESVYESTVATLEERCHLNKSSTSSLEENEVMQLQSDEDIVSPDETDIVQFDALEGEEYQLMMIQETGETSDQHTKLDKELDIVTKVSETSNNMQLACTSATDQNMTLQLHVPLKKPLQTLHDLVTHNVELVNTPMLEQQQREEEGDNESTATNFQQVAREADLSSRYSTKGGKKSKKQNQNREQQKPSRIIPRGQLYYPNND
ncbi:hypothetical protein A4A49_43859 [Nicotiana attenuata]|uniref:Uncharacterized protein n=1 Tax=Nicotiana attenuata TaxID=49451 RepID=A0A1J6IF30_NICAT|nr:hypothetical protein A4A49_57534 [Nicotiana attenuata]OIT18623.1 hypothetical protein A4A49_43859 [Nicotiana attenuata]